MSKKNILSVFILSSLLSTNSFAYDNNYFKNFDILGVKTGMESKEVNEKLYKFSAYVYEFHNEKDENGLNKPHKASYFFIDKNNLSQTNVFVFYNKNRQAYHIANFTTFNNLKTNSSLKEQIESKYNINLNSKDNKKYSFEKGITKEGKILEDYLICDNDRFHLFHDFSENKRIDNNSFHNETLAQANFNYFKNINIEKRNTNKCSYYNLIQLNNNGYNIVIQQPELFQNEELLKDNKIKEIKIEL